MVPGGRSVLNHVSQVAPKWTRAEARPAMERKFRFQDRTAAWGFVAKLALLLDTDHFSLEWASNRVKIILTWDESRPESEPLQLAQRINGLL